jgi:4-hydroxy-tetrahydrodipicolinate reductase
MKIGIAGYKGRIGTELLREIHSGSWDDLEFVGGTSRQPEYEPFPVYDDPARLFNICDCMIDFTAPSNTLKNLDAAIATKKSMVIGTTGFTEAQEQKIRDAAKHIPIVFAANMSVGVTLLLSLVEQAAAKLGPEWDIEIFESHHKNKIDAPSGTALALGNAAQKERGSGAFKTDRAGKRIEGDIGYAVSRGGDVVGEHDVTFYGMGERLTLSHKATNRALFARGALQAAQWLNGKPAGLYTMRDVLGL